MSQFAFAATISLLLALVAGATVWIIWSVIENVRAARNLRTDHRRRAVEPPGE